MVSKEEVRILVADFGYQETAKRTGIKYSTLRQWSRRYKWSQPPALKPNHNPIVTSVTKPSDIHAMLLNELERDTKMSLAKSAARLSKDAEGATLRDSGHVKEVAQTAAIVHRWNQDKGNTQILNIGILTGAERPQKVIDATEVE